MHLQGIYSYLRTSKSFLAEVSVRSPGFFFILIIIIKKCIYRIEVSKTTFDFILKTKALLCTPLRIVANVHALQGLRSNQLHQELRYYSLLNIIEL